jgi:L-fuconolactonase
MNAVIDSHVHLYDVDALHYDWMAGEPDLNRSHLLDDYAKAAAGADVAGIVFVEVNCRPEEAIAEVDWVVAQAAGDPPILGIVAFAPAEAEHLTAHLDRLADIPLVRGVRRLVQGDPVSLMESPDFHRGLGQIAERGLTFDLCCESWQLPAAIELVGALDDVPFVLDHLGKPDIENHEWEPWATAMAQLAAFENVLAAKLSGLHSEGPADHTERYLAHAIEVFGPTRLMVGSDWPVCNQRSSHPAWIAAIDEALQPLSAHEQETIRTGTATRVYRLES